MDSGARERTGLSTCLKRVSGWAQEAGGEVRGRQRGRERWGGREERAGGGAEVRCASHGSSMEGKSRPPRGPRWALLVRQGAAAP
jgi:hypothetical protein